MIAAYAKSAMEGGKQCEERKSNEIGQPHGENSKQWVWMEKNSTES